MDWRRRSNRPGNSQAKGPQLRATLESSCAETAPLTEGGKPVLRNFLQSWSNLSGSLTDGVVLEWVPVSSFCLDCLGGLYDNFK
jgi:hypothetical protein